jgi:hypothetical protein
MIQDLKNPTVKRKVLLNLIRRRVRAGTGGVLHILKERTMSLNVPKILREVTAPYAIIGALATRLYMPERMTRDVDILTLDFVKARQQLRDLGFVSDGELLLGGGLFDTGEAFIFPAEATEYFVRLNVLASRKAWAQEAIASRIVAPDGFPYALLPHLVLMKIEASRPQDIADISRMLGAAAEDEFRKVVTFLERIRPEFIEDVHALREIGLLEFSPPEA